jgi:hypothetical protein
VPSVSYTDLQIGQERRLYPFVEKYSQFAGVNEAGHYQQQSLGLKQSYYRMMSHGIRLDGLDYLDQLISTVQSRLNCEYQVTTFLIQSSEPCAFCMPQYGPDRRTHTGHIVIGVSHHFFENLDSDIERLSVLAHEFGHMLFKHSQILKLTPAVQKKLGLGPEDVGRFLRWSICCEVSCDLCSLAVLGGHPGATASSLLKFTTGLGRKFAEVGSFETLRNLVERQFEDVSGSAHQQELSTHPITSLRIRCLQKASETQLIKSFGRELGVDEIKDAWNELNAVVEQELARVYADLGGKAQMKRLRPAMTYLLAACAVAENHFDDAAREFICEMVDARVRFEGLLPEPMPWKRESASRLASEAVVAAQRMELSRGEVLAVIRTALLICLRDEVISPVETALLGNFGAQFSIGYEEIDYMSYQLQEG